MNEDDLIFANKEHLVALLFKTAQNAFDNFSLRKDPAQAKVLAETTRLYFDLTDDKQTNAADAITFVYPVNESKSQQKAKETAIIKKATKIVGK